MCELLLVLFNVQLKQGRKHGKIGSPMPQFWNVAEKCKCEERNGMCSKLVHYDQFKYQNGP
jgi:hypothetical protein